ncbi:MAG: asparagine synthase (glutamine-hydrolyzing) [Calditrichaceae bacterium]|nr:asparagine synthase (glutamine-hydrolyzing) [Calditrichaceae bacterium]MBN2708005.1 asparagine synthase (glutamine-hydrolyzing) [Calditrichaceae bacterium]RQV95175.1 MAG: asparagine synthase (glutamine-hydrolyzing) [Calditrichota bacterium]
MCGIAGIYNFQSNKSVKLDQIQHMVSSLNHRGPDECGFLIDRNFGMGMSRLSIIDLSGGSQPLHNEDRSIWIVFNGEIFNYIELRQELEFKGHHFYTHSDTEAIVHCYEEYGVDFVKYLNGQFAISIWDVKKKKLILARDRVGIRPLFYSLLNNNSIFFASEMKAIFAEGTINPEIDEIGIAQIFTYWVNIPPVTSFKNVNELPAGHVLICNHKGTEIKPYWDMQFPANGGFDKRQKAEIIDELKDQINKAIALRLRADVPVAAYLSGGIDSSIISTLVKRNHNNNLTTFSVAFKDKDYDERTYQEQMVAHLGTNHHMCEVDAHDIAEAFIDVVWYAEKPMMRTAPAPLFALSKLVRDNNIKVVLTGEGADEIFGGYNIFKESLVRRFWSRQPDSEWRPLLLSRLYPYILKDARHLNTFWQGFFKKGLKQTHLPYYSHLIRWDNTSKTRVFFNNSIKHHYNTVAEHQDLNQYFDADIKNMAPLNQAQYIESKLFMTGYLLSSQGDRMMMGNSVEGRFPFLDHQVIEFASKISPHLKVNGLNEKYILKEAYKDILPEGIIYRSKQPYRAPILSSFLSDKTPELIKELLRPQAIKQYGYFNYNSVDKLLRKGKNISAKNDMAVAALVSVQLLHYHYIERFGDHDFRLAEKQTVINLN